MKHLILRTSAALACAAALASCGGGSTGTLQIYGNVSGVTQDGLVILNNGGSDLTIPANATSYTFKDLVPTDSVFNITFKNMPGNTIGCTATPATGNTGLYSVRVDIACTITTYSLTGTVTGLNGQTGLILSNGPNRVPVAADGPFTMAPVSLGYPYGINVLQQPAKGTCTVANGVGTIAAAVDNVKVTCVGTGA